jgi:hypothetical protein
MATSRTSNRNPESPNMVLRTVYLPVSMDEDLKNAALLTGRSKNELIRELVATGLAAGTQAAAALARSHERTIAPVDVKPAVRKFDEPRQAERENLTVKVAKALAAAKARAKSRATKAKTGAVPDPRFPRYVRVLLKAEEDAAAPAKASTKKRLGHRHRSKVGTGKKGSRPGRTLQA